MSKGASTPSFDRLYDSARRLQGTELVLELRDSPWDRRRAVARAEGTRRGQPVHERRAEGNVDAAAAEVIEAVEADPADI